MVIDVLLCSRYLRWFPCRVLNRFRPIEAVHTGISIILMCFHVSHCYGKQKKHTRLQDRWLCTRIHICLTHTYIDAHFKLLTIPLLITHYPCVVNYAGRSLSLSLSPFFYSRHLRVNRAALKRCFGSGFLPVSQLRMVAADRFGFFSKPFAIKPNLGARFWTTHGPESGLCSKIRMIHEWPTQGQVFQGFGWQLRIPKRLVRKVCDLGTESLPIHGFHQLAQTWHTRFVHTGLLRSFTLETHVHLYDV